MVNRVVFISLLLLPVLSFSEDHIIYQEDVKFSVPIKVIKPGDNVIFRNQDTVVHNIISLTDGFKFDLGIVRPGKSKSVIFGDEEGVVDIQCTVHPGMKMTLFLFD